MLPVRRAAGGQPCKPVITGIGADPGHHTSISLWLCGVDDFGRDATATKIDLVVTAVTAAL